MFTDIQIPADYFRDILRRQAIVNPNLLFLLRLPEGGALKRRILYRNGIADYVRELAGDDAMTDVQVWTAERKGRDQGRTSRSIGLS